MSDNGVSIDFCHRLPKVELHAHLSGSITRPILQAIWEERAAGDEAFREAVTEPRIALSDDKAGQDINSFFAHFNTYIYKVVSSITSLQTATRACLQAFQDDGVVYLELRTTPRSFENHAPEETVTAVVQILEEWNSTQRMTVNLILSIDQAKHDGSQAMDIVELALKLREEGRPVVGVDLCGEPNKPVDRSIFRPAFQKAREEGLGVTIHFAEVPASSTRQDLEEELSWQPRRLGHVIHVPPDMRKEIIRRGIGVELCLTCNVLAGMLPSSAIVDGSRPSFVQHHFRDWWGEGGDMPLVSLGTDDVGVFGSWSSDEHWLASEHFCLSEDDLLRLSRCAMRTAFCDEATKTKVSKTMDDFDGRR